MRASLRIEAIADNTFQYARFWRGVLESGAPGAGRLLELKADYWCAMITGFDPQYKYSRQFMAGKKDYTKSNSIGSRGVFLYYLLESGYVYEVSQPITWKRCRRYFCTVTDAGEIIEVSKEYVDQWVSEHSV